MNTEQERAAFEAACRKHAEESGYDGHDRFERDGDGYADPHTQAAWWGWREGRAALQSQDRSLSHLEKDRIATAAHVKASAIPGATFYNAAKFALDGVKTQSQDAEDAERLDFLSSVNNMGCSLVSDDDGRWAFSDSGVAPVPPNGGFTEYVSIVSWVEPDMWKEDIREAIDHARRVEEIK